MLEQFLPQVCPPHICPLRLLTSVTWNQETLDRLTASKARSKNPEATLASTNSGAWAPGVSVQRVAWNNGNGLGSCQLLVSGTGSGLCRIDWVTGRWFKDRKLGSGGIEALRGEVDGDGDVDMDDAEGDGEGLD
jgi:transcription factor C subunit 6